MVCFFLFSFAERELQEDFPSNYYEWTSLYKLFVRKHGGIRQMQTYVLKRCLRNRQALEEHFQLSLHSSRQQKWYQFLEDRDAGNRKALKALTEHMPRVTHSYMLHQVWGHLLSNSEGDTKEISADGKVDPEAIAGNLHFYLICIWES